MRLRKGRAAAVPLVLLLPLGLLAGCANPPPGSPEEAQLQHQYQTGCRPVDAQGYERLLEYCGHGGGNRR